MSKENIASLRRMLFLAMANHGRAHVLNHMPGMNLARTEKEVRKRAQELSEALGHPLGPLDLFVGGTEVPNVPLIQMMIQHGLDHLKVAASEAELVNQAVEFSASTGHEFNDGDFAPFFEEFVTWYKGM